MRPVGALAEDDDFRPVVQTRPRHATERLGGVQVTAEEGRHVRAAGELQTLMEFRHQWIVVHEFLPEVLDPEVYADVFRPNGRIRTRYFDPRHAAEAVMPVEFAVAAYRFGHSQVRNAYRITQGGGFVPVFNGTADDLHGGRPIAPEHIIFWPNFVNVDGVPPTGAAESGSPVNISRKMDTLLSSALFQLPIPGAEPGGPSILALRNLQRGREYGLPSGPGSREASGDSGPLQCRHRGLDPPARHTAGPGVRE